MFDSVEGATDGATLDTATAKKLALESYTASTNWIDSGVRVRWSNSLRALVKSDEAFIISFATVSRR